MMTSRQAMFDALSAFHNETAQNNRIQIVKQRQLDCPELFSCKRLLSGWNDVFASKIKAPQERGGSTTCAIAIDVAEWQARHHEFITEVAKTTKQFVSMNLLTNVRKLIFMDLLFLRGCNVYHIHQLNSQPPSRSSPRAGIRAPNRDGNRGDDESLPGSRRASARRKLDATAASDGGGDADDDEAAADDDNDDNDAAAPVGGAVAAAATITTTEDDAAADDEGGGNAANEVFEDGGGGGGDIDWTTWHPLPPWPEIFNSLKVPRVRDFANYGPGHALAILFFYNPDLKSLFPNLNNDIHAGWMSAYRRAMTVDGLNLFPVFGVAAMSEDQQKWCRETIRFLQDNLSDEQREEMGIPARPGRRKGRMSSTTPGPNNDGEAEENNSDDGQLRRKTAGK